MTRVAVVGAGIGGAACAAALRVAGVEVEVLDRGRAPGGRMSAPLLHDRRVDLGAAYVTAADAGFRALVDDWAARGLVRPWTDTVDAYGPDSHDRKPGPVRWAARDGLRALVRDLDPQARPGVEITALDDLDHDALVLAMPDPQARRIVGPAVEWVDYDPVVAVALGYSERCWPFPDAAFVNDDADLALVADDGARRGDGAAVLVVHTTGALAARCLQRPEDAVAPVRAALHRVLGISAEPLWTHAHRWTFAKPAATHGAEEFGLLERDGRLLGLCGDSWCPGGSPRIEAAWLSGHRLGTALAERL